ncbi:MAG TPA: ATP-binding protein [Gemmatimonadaceae bacterium]|nr:ATP-binding protein [Gemmatimonadaceae bacterium]
MQERRTSRSVIWGVVPLALIGLALLGSVAIPARQTWHISRLLSLTTTVIAPARLLVEALQTGLAEEFAELQGYVLSGDDILLRRYRVSVDDDERRVTELERLATRVDPTAAGRARILQSRIGEWHRFNDALIAWRGSRGQRAAAFETGQARYDSSLSAIAQLSSRLAAASATQDDKVRALEHLSIVVNATLVLAALVAMSGVLVLALRERRLSAALHRRIVEESALRQLARRLSTAVTRGEALRGIARGALATTPARGVCVEWRISRERVVAFVATVGEGEPAPCTRAPYSGSLTEEFQRRGIPAVSGDVDTIDGRLAVAPGGDEAHYTDLVVPLLSADEARGVLVLLGDPAAPAFGDDERRQLRRVSDLASAALRRVDGLVAVQRALRKARDRAQREAALREAAESLAGASTMDEVMPRIVHAALGAMRGRGAFVEHIVGRPGEPADVAVCAAAGTGVPPLTVTRPFAGSYTELVTRSGEPALIADLAHRERSGTLDAMQDVAGSAIAVPLGDATAPRGALFVVSPARRRFRPDDVARAGIFGHLAARAHEKARLLEAAHERRRALETVIQSRSRLMRGFSHDVKNPIGAADGFAELLSLGVYGELSTDQAASIERLRRSIHTALELINELHDLARAESGRIALSSEPVDLAELARTLGEEYHAAAQGRGLTLSVDVGHDRQLIETDRARAGQVAANLLSNAIKYTQHGSVLVRVRRQPVGPSGAEGAWALIEFADTGPGIPPDKKDYIFEEFSRLDGGDTPGAGLGLAISKLLAQALGGRITVESELGRGSTFTLWLPVRRAAGTA